MSGDFLRAEGELDSGKREELVRLYLHISLLPFASLHFSLFAAPMSSPFPLLRLPGLVLCDVFRSLNIGEKIQLSIYSKKISTQINNCRLYSQNVIVDLSCLSHKIRVHSENNRDTFEISNYSDSCKSQNSNTHQFSIACCSVRVISIPKGITLGKNHREAFLSVIRHLLKMFQCKFSTTISYCNSDLYQPTIAMLFDLRMEFKTIIIDLNGSEDRILLWNQISKKLELVEDLVILSDLNLFRYFTPVFASWPQKISIMDSVVFTLESLLACTCTAITHRRSHMKNKDLDVILKNWKAGGLPNLKCLRLDYLMITDDGGHILGTTFRELNGMVIETDDGSKKATIITYAQCIEMSVTPII
ncbi:hypothetical protein GCK72_003170 [Caenorhabditis remanei]|uniref:F-box domain-containing protein n=1 Tax=Caenorhabditis remanei TaxID=31234 RepID=A0A6A5HWV3_CAERE|nr:hypothetical protein GCK72_003170 [Caenorhabditis remanei]KAF1771344.1 hypothetical protein GCK72_003170 [Caenorhabditis remanei]